MGGTALVLSAGGMFGAYQAGVWLELERRLKPDLIVGASIGALNGWAIAGGVTGEELARSWLELGRPGLLRRAQANAWIRGLYETYRPRVEYGLVATTLPSLRPRLFRWPGLTWRHLAGSCAIPFVFEQQRIDGSLCSDGGLVIPAPVWAAVELGATRIVSVNLLAVRPRLIESAARFARWYSHFDPQPPDVPVIEISPTGRLGTMRDSITWSREQAERLIAMGREDASGVLHWN